MALGISIEVKIYKNGELLKKITEQAKFGDDKHKRYIESLKISQNNVNLYLSTLVEQERNQSAASSKVIEVSSVGSSEESSENEMPRKKLKSVPLSKPSPYYHRS